MSKKIEFKIPTQCHENWDKMQPVDQGKFCLSCTKTVVDFSQMTNQEILLHISKSRGDVCGRFSQNQLNHKINLPGERKATWKYAWNMLLAVFLSGSAANSQIRPMQGKVKIVNKPLEVKPDIQIMGFVTMTAPHKFFKARIIDADDNKPVSFASITVNQGGRQFAADASGNFSVMIKPNQPDQYIEISATGYESKLITLKDLTHGDSKAHVFQLNKKVHELPLVTVIAYPTISCGPATGGLPPGPLDSTLGGVMLGGMVSVQSKTIVQTVRDTITTIFKNNNLTIFPSPVSRGSIMNLRFDLQEMDKYETLIINNAGQVLSRELINVLVKNQVKQIFIPSTYPKGIYFVRVQKPRSKIIYNKKFIII